MARSASRLCFVPLVLATASIAVAESRVEDVPASYDSGEHGDWLAREPAEGMARTNRDIAGRRACEAQGAHYERVHGPPLFQSQGQLECRQKEIWDSPQFKCRYTNVVALCWRAVAVEPTKAAPPPPPPVPPSPPPAQTATAPAASEPDESQPTPSPESSFESQTETSPDEAATPSSDSSGASETQQVLDSWNEQQERAKQQFDMLFGEQTKVHIEPSSGSGGGGLPGHGELALFTGLSDAHLSTEVRGEAVMSFFGLNAGVGAVRPFDATFSETSDQGVRSDTEIGWAFRGQWGAQLQVFNPHDWSVGKGRRHRASVGADLGVLYDGGADNTAFLWGLSGELSVEVLEDFGLLARGGKQFVMDPEPEDEVWAHWFVGVGLVHYVGTASSGSP